MGSLKVEAESEGATMQGHPEAKAQSGGVVGGGVATALRDFQKFGLGDQIPSLNTEGKQEC